MTTPPPGVLSAPLPVPRRFTLLDAATVVTDADGRTPAGVTVDAYPAAQASVQEAFASGSARVKAIDAEFANPDVFAYTVYLGVTCTTVSVRGREQEFRRRLQAAFRAVESAGVERILVDADGTMNGAYLTDANMATLGAGAVGPVEALALLENAIAAVGNGMIHVTPAGATALASKYLIEENRDNQMRTRIGTLVAVGAGYIGAYPQGGSAPTGDQDWAFASSFVEVHRDDDTILSGQLSQSLDRSTNDVTFIAERNYLVAWVGRQDPSDANHIQAGVLIDRSA